LIQKNLKKAIAVIKVIHPISFIVNSVDFHS